jgi:hypothetical protein
MPAVLRRGHARDASPWMSNPFRPLPIVSIQSMGPGAHESHATLFYHVLYLITIRIRRDECPSRITTICATEIQHALDGAHHHDIDMSWLGQASLVSSAHFHLIVCESRRGVSRVQKTFLRALAVVDVMYSMTICFLVLDKFELSINQSSGNYIDVTRHRLTLS